MELNYALDELYATGWAALDSAGCSHHTDGRAYPTVPRVAREFVSSGYTFDVQRIDLFDCYRAKWSGADADDAGSVVGRTEEEAAVYALAQHRRQLVAAGA